MADISKIKTLDGTSYDVKDATARNQITEAKVLVITSSSTFTGTKSSASMLASNDSRITSNMVVINSVFSNPAQVSSDITWTTTDGNVKISGTFGSTGSKITMYLAEQM